MSFYHFDNIETNDNLSLVSLNIVGPCSYLGGWNETYVQVTVHSNHTMVNTEVFHKATVEVYVR